MRIKVVAICYPKNQDEFIAQAMDLAEKSRKDLGCISYELCKEDKGRILFVEEWESRGLLDLHSQTRKSEVEKLWNLCERESEVMILHVV